VNGICGCGLPARCCQPAVAGGVIYADLSGELSTHLAPQALFTQSSPVLEEVTLHLLSQACVFVYSSCGKWVFPPLLWSFPPSTTLTSFPAPACSACARPLLEPLQPAGLVYLQFQEGFPSPNLQHSVHPTLFPMCLYCSYCLLLSFSFFPGWRLVCPGVYAALAQGCLWLLWLSTSALCIAMLTLSVSSQAVWVQVTPVFILV
jgi:hypothetical protein